MQQITRYIGDNGQLLRYEIKNEMNIRAARYHKAHKRAQLLEDMKALAFTFTVMALLVAWYLINN